MICSDNLIDAADMTANMTANMTAAAVRLVLLAGV